MFISLNNHNNKQNVTQEKKLQDDDRFSLSVATPNMYFPSKGPISKQSQL